MTGTDRAADIRPHASATAGFTPSDARPEGVGDVANPAFSAATLDPVSDTLDASTDFTKRQHAEEQVALLYTGPPSRNARMAARPLSDLGDDAGIDEPGQQVDRTPGIADRARSMSSSGAAASSSFRLRVGSGPKRRRAGRAPRLVGVDKRRRHGSGQEADFAADPPNAPGRGCRRRRCSVTAVTAAAVASHGAPQHGFQRYPERGAGLKGTLARRLA